MESKMEDLKVESRGDIVTSTGKLALTSEASFGDGMDIFHAEKIVSEGGTIIFTIDVRRQFESGEYVMHILETGATADLTEKVAILCLDGLCPLKIHNRLNTSNMAADFRSGNYMNRYDWMHFRNWSTGSEELWTKRRNFIKIIRKEVLQDPMPEPSGSSADGAGSRSSKADAQSEDFVSSRSESEGEECEEEEQSFDFRNLVYFVDTTRTVEIGAGKFTCIKENDWIWGMRNERKELLGFVILAKRGAGLVGGDWNYGCVLVDKNTSKCFAFVFGDYYTEKTYLSAPNPTDLDIGKINYTFDKAEFKK